MTTRLQIMVYENRELRDQAEFDGPVTLGRQREREEALFTRRKMPTGWRWVIASREEVSVGRNQLTIHPLGDNRARVVNGSDRNPIRFLDRPDLPPGASCELPLPVLVILGPTKTVRAQQLGGLLPREGPPATTAHPSVHRGAPAAHDAPRPGSGDAPQAAADRYATLQPLATGAVSTISIAQDRELKRLVALKELRPDLVGHAGLRARFTREIEITAQLDHPGVLAVYDSGTRADGRPFFTMHLVRGENLARAIDRCHQLLPTDPAGYLNRAFRRLVRQFRRACRVVEHAHTQSVIHRDLKPGNIMLGQHGDTYVIDWGLAKALGGPDDPPRRDAGGAIVSSVAEDTRHGAVMGTYGYASPEQIGAAGPVGPASDIYALGATLYHLLTGRPPFVPAGSDSALEHRSPVFPPPREVDRAIPPHLEAICLRAMSAAIGDRYPTAAALSAAVGRWLARPV